MTYGDAACSGAASGSRPSVARSSPRWRRRTKWRTMAASSRQAGIVTSPPSELSGAIAGRYILEGVIGRGGTSVVYRARDDESGRAVAVKLLREELVESSGAKRVLREIRVLG